MRVLAALTAALFLMPGAFALSTEDADKAVAAFITAGGYTAVPDDAHVAGETGYTKRFERKPDDALNPDAEVGPVEKALLIVETMENDTAGRVRYAVSYGQVTEEADGKSDIISLVEVRRYNMGPLIHKQTQDEYGPENTADAAEFGVGPDVAWRFAFSSVMGNLALPLSISRKVIGEGAEQMKVDPNDLCPTGPCRGAEGANGFDVKTINPKADAALPAEVPDFGTPRYSATTDSSTDGVVSAALVARTLSAMLKLTEPAGMPGVWRTPAAPEGGGGDTGAPFVVFQIDQELGNGGGTAALGAITRMADDDVAQLWTLGTFNAGIPPYEPHTQIVRAR